MNRDDHSALSVEVFKKKDIDEVFRLSTQVEWNQTESDWLRLLELNPKTCFLYRFEGKTVGTSTLATYGLQLAWIGMIIVDSDFRGKGIGKYILETTIREARHKGYEIIGLDATDQGRRLYRNYGFHDVQPIDRWVGKLAVSGQDSRGHPLDDHHLQEVISLDRQWSGCDRSKLLRHLFQEESIQGLGVTRNNNLCGFTFLRPGLNFRHIGPLLSETQDDFTALLNAAAVSLQGESVLVDALRRNETSKLLEQHNLNVQRQLMRMTFKKPQAVLSDPRLRVAVSFEWG